MSQSIEELSPADRRLLERHFAGQLTENEQQKVQERAKRDAAFGRAFRQMRQASAAADDAPAAAGEAREALSPRFAYRLTTVAVVVLLLLAPLYLYWRSHNQSGNTLFETHFEAYPVQKEVAQDAPEPVAKALQAYRMENYEMSIGYFQEYLVQNPQAYPYRLYLGIALLVEDMTSAAFQTFKDIQDHAETPWREEARWYLALAHLQAGRRREAQEVLKEVASGSSRHAAPAEALLKKL